MAVAVNTQSLLGEVLPSAFVEKITIESSDKDQNLVITLDLVINEVIGDDLLTG